MKGLRFYPLKNKQIAYHNDMDAGRRQSTPRSEAQQVVNLHVPICFHCLGSMVGAAQAVGLYHSLGNPDGKSGQAALS